MTYRPYPNRDRALRQVQRNRDAYLYGRVPQRIVLGVGESPLAVVGAMVESFRRQAPLTLAAAGRTLATQLGKPTA